MTTSCQCYQVDEDVTKLLLKGCSFLWRPGLRTRLCIRLPLTGKRTGQTHELTSSVGPPPVSQVSHFHSPENPSEVIHLPGLWMEPGGEETGTGNSQTPTTTQAKERPRDTVETLGGSTFP